VITLDKKNHVYLLKMNAGGNRWNTSFVREFSDALDKVELDDGPGALVTSSMDERFFSNGLDLDWVKNTEKYPQVGSPCRQTITSPSLGPSST
tara:strand:- start:4097 stop:4375 length:279 start_codon:yes stop_codon:yes gene_type:complete